MYSHIRIFYDMCNKKVQFMQCKYQFTVITSNYEKYTFEGTENIKIAT